MPENKLDFFARIALERVQQRDQELIEPVPSPPPQQIWQAEWLSVPQLVEPAEKLDCQKKLDQELASYRHKFAPFMRDCAPPCQHTRNTIEVERFDWRVETTADRSDFKSALDGEGDWQPVVVPHYGPPLGRKATIYRTTIDLTAPFFSAGSIFIRFDGVDYRTQVFVNNSFIGTHEGFFAPFEFDITAAVRPGKNCVVIRVENDYIFMGSRDENSPERYEGEKLYAATGPGYDDAEMGWHHCPPAMGIYQTVFIEARSRMHIADCFVRFLPDGCSGEAWITVHSADVFPGEVLFNLSVYGKNFDQIIFQNKRFSPQGLHIPGLGDVAKRVESALPLKAGAGENLFRVPFVIDSVRRWDLDSPWLYQLQVDLLGSNGVTIDSLACDFGMRTFRMDTADEPRGRFFLNDRPIKLRGANTMGHEQQCVMRKNLEQLRDDILLAKIAGLNFLRLTQRPVQRQVYEMCDRLGMLTQSDLPLFGVLRRPKWLEAVRQVGEMVRLVRDHPCNALISYINEPFPNGMDEPHRHLLRSELQDFFTIADLVARQENPDQVIKAVDGDYDPPAPGFPDNHCYCGWYNGHGIDLGKLHKGYWQKVKPGWNYGCGEFGSEGLDPVDLMRRHYPAEWLPQSAKVEKTWSPDRILQAQTGRFHYLWFETPASLQDWVEASHAHQAWITRLMTEAFRRNRHMHSFAIHLLIDAFPAGWMKAIVDSERRAKPAYFAYREALTPLLVCWRSDRQAWSFDEEIELEAWICNDTAENYVDLRLVYTLEKEGQIAQRGEQSAAIKALDSYCPAQVRFQPVSTSVRCEWIARLRLFDQSGALLSESESTLSIFPSLPAHQRHHFYAFSALPGPAATLLQTLNIAAEPIPDSLPANAVVILDGLLSNTGEMTKIEQAVKAGATAVVLLLAPGEMTIAGDRIKVEKCGMGERHFVARCGHHLTSGFGPKDFSFWYSAPLDRVTPFLDTVFVAPGWTPILISGNGSWQADWEPKFAAAEKRSGKGVWRICQLHLHDHITGNPAAEWFARRLLDLIDWNRIC